MIPKGKDAGDSVLTAVTITVGLCILLGVSGFIYFRFFFLPNLFKPGPIKNVSSEAWAELQLGMTKQQVVALLGEPPSRTSDGTGEEATIPEFWEYTWSDGFLFGPSDKAHVVYFDSDGKVSSFREPKSKEPDSEEHMQFPD